MLVYILCSNRHRTVRFSINCQLVHSKLHGSDLGHITCVSLEVTNINCTNYGETFTEKKMELHIPLMLRIVWLMLPQAPVFRLAKLLSLIKCVLLNPMNMPIYI